MHRVFVSYYHGDQAYKDELVSFGVQNSILVDGSVDTGDIDDALDDQAIREKIRDDYLRDTTVTIVLVGTETKYRKHVDWEIYSSMIDGQINKKSGVVVVTLPTTSCTYYTAAHSGEKEAVYPENHSWTTIDARAEYERRYPYMPDRIIDNLLKKNALISITNWSKLQETPERLRFLVDSAFEDADEAVRRVAQRVAAGGHGVPEADVRRRFERGLLLFREVYKPLADEWYHWFSDERGLRLVDHHEST